MFLMSLNLLSNILSNIPLIFMKGNCQQLSYLLWISMKVIVASQNTHRRILLGLYFVISGNNLGMVMHACNARTWEADGGGWRIWNSLGYRMNSRPHWAGWLSAIWQTSTNQNRKVSAGSDPSWTVCSTQ